MKGRRQTKCGVKPKPFPCISKSDRKKTTITVNRLDKRRAAYGRFYPKKGFQRGARRTDWASYESVRSSVLAGRYQ